MGLAYNLANVVCTVSGVAISGYGETDAITLEWDEDVNAVTVTADGLHIYSRNNNRGMTVTVTLNQKSRAYPLLSQIFEGQTGDNIGIAPPLLLPCPFMLIDPSNGDTYASLDCVFLTRPAPSKGKAVGDVQFKMHLSSPLVSNGTANLASI
jgi:hypothetical protein